MSKELIKELAEISKKISDLLNKASNVVAEKCLGHDGTEQEMSHDHTDEPEMPQNSLWIPFAKRSAFGVVYPNLGPYKTPSKLPIGATIHFNAGRGGTSGVKTRSDAEMRAKNLITYLASQKYGCIVIDVFGTVYQNQPLDQYCSHAGESSWNGVTSVNSKFVGIELMGAGMLTKKNGKWFTWFNSEVVNPFVFEEKAKRENIKAGGYEIASKQQVIALFKVLAWLKLNFKDFKVENICGHDECSPTRKNDPGAMFMMTGNEYRAVVNEFFETAKSFVVIDSPDDKKDEEILTQAIEKTLKIKHFFENFPSFA